MGRDAHGYEGDHTPVRCDECTEEYTACQLGNHYCPTCGSSLDDSRCVHCPCYDQGGDCCFCELAA